MTWLSLCLRDFVVNRVFSGLGGKVPPMCFATLMQGASPFGPIFAKELRVTSRRKRTYWLRVIYLGLLLLVMLWAYALATAFRQQSGIAMQNQQRSELGQIFFAIVGIFSVYSMGLIGPILTSTAIGSERLHKTLPVLLMTPITAWQIVAGKLFSRLLAALTLIALGLPVLALVRLLGGVELKQMGIVVSLAVVVALSSAAIGLFYSTLLNRSVNVILLSYGTMLLMYCFFPIVVALIAARFHTIGAGLLGTKIALSANPYMLAVMAAIPRMGMRGFPISIPYAACIASHLVLSAVLLVFCALLLRRHARRAGEERGGLVPVEFAPIGAPLRPPMPAAPFNAMGAGAMLPPPAVMLEGPIFAGSSAAFPPLAGPGVAPPPLPSRGAITRKAVKPRKSHPVTDNPILWRELRRPLMGRGWQRRAGIIIVLAVIGTIYYAQYYTKSLNDRGPQIGYAIILNVLLSMLALILSATAIAQEKESDTWTLLLGAPLSGRTIVWGKMMGVLRRLAWPFILIVAHFLLFTVIGAISVPAFLVVIWVLFTFNVVWVASGVYFSLRMSKTTVAALSLIH